MVRLITCLRRLTTLMDGGLGHVQGPHFDERREYLNQVQAGMLSCDPGHGLRNVTDGTSNTVLLLEDAGRSHPSVGKVGAFSSRPSVVSSPVDPVQGKAAAGR